MQQGRTSLPAGSLSKMSRTKMRRGRRKLQQSSSSSGSSRTNSTMFACSNRVNESERTRIRTRTRRRKRTSEENNSIGNCKFFKSPFKMISHSMMAAPLVWVALVVIIIQFQIVCLAESTSSSLQLHAAQAQVRRQLTERASGSSSGGGTSSRSSGCSSSSSTHSSGTDETPGKYFLHACEIVE